MKLAMMHPGPAPVALLEDEVVALAKHPALQSEYPGSLPDVLARGEAFLRKLEAVVRDTAEAPSSQRERYRESGVLRPLADVRLAAPFPAPGLLLFTGGNYQAHLDEISRRTGTEIEAPESPIGFIKNSHTVIGPGDDIVLPSRYPHMIDFEAEFSFVIGRPCHDITEREAGECIAGYTIVNDVSARDWNQSAKRADGSMDLTMPTFGKQFPTFCPMGPAFVTRDEIPDPYDVDIRLTLNGEVMQEARTDDLIFGFERILSYFSQFFEFRPGDVLTTGSPPGVGFARDPAVFLEPGDRVEITATRIGTLANNVRADS